MSAEPGRSVMAVIEDLRSGVVRGASLSGEDRRECVAYLTGEGYSVAEIARVLGVSDRTVARDRLRVREANAVARDPSMVSRMVGQLLAEADGAVGRLRRLGRERGAPVAARVEAERAAWSVQCDLVRLLQRLGYLPEATRYVSADVTHRLEADEVPTFGDLDAELIRLERIQRLEGGQADPRIGEARRLVARMAVSEVVTDLNTASGKEAGDDDDDEN